MIKIKHILILGIVALINTSCFEIVEEINLKNNGSGTFKYTVNFSQSLTKIKSLMTLDEIEGYKVPTQSKIEYEINKICNISKTVKGITNVKHTSDFKNYIFTYSCNFNKIENLNAVIDSLSHKKKEFQNHKSNYYSYSVSKKILTRLGDDLLTNAYNKLPESQKSIFTTAKYVSLYRFENEVIKVSNPKVLVAKNKKAVLHRLDLVLLAKNGKKVNKQIQLK